MRFSRFLWDLWATSDDGTRAIRRWRSLAASLRNEAKLDRPPAFAAADGSPSKIRTTDPDKVGDELLKLDLDPDIVRAVVAACGRQNLVSDEAARAAYERELAKGIRIPSAEGGVLELGGNSAREWATRVADLSIGFWAAQPDRFVPYPFPRRFSVFRDIADEFEISLPDPPGEGSWEKRARYYLDVNEALLEFGRRFALGSADLAALLHDFAPLQLSSQVDAAFPPARAVWWQHAGTNNNGDFALLDGARDDTTTWWQGNDQARRGDIAVIWCLTPRSSVHSIWKITEDGHYDPFTYFSRLVTVGHPVLGLPKVTFAELAADSILSKWPAVRAHFQGASGRELPPDVYGALLEIYRRKGVDLARLPVAESLALPDGIEIHFERDVEERLLEPLLVDLGYSDAVWRRQLSVRMGRGERYYPDYAVGIRGKRGEERCKVVAEAKLTIATERGLVEAFRQARSYALRLEAEFIVLAAVEGFWVIERSAKGFAAPAPTSRVSWTEARSATARAQLARRIGARALGVRT